MNHKNRENHPRRKEDRRRADDRTKGHDAKKLLKTELVLNNKKIILQCKLNDYKFQKLRQRLILNGYRTNTHTLTHVYRKIKTIVPSRL